MSAEGGAKEFSSALDAEVARHLAELWSGGSGGVDGDALRAALDDAVTGGKRFRPHLLAGVHHSLGGGAHAAVAQTAAAVELLHTAFVIHDDVIDGDDVRRGRPSIPGRFRRAARDAGSPPERADTYALAGAVLTGDLALSAAFRAIATTPAPSDVRQQVLDLVSQASSASAAGELTDVRLSVGGEWPTVVETLELAEHKTAAYSFVLPMQLGAVLAGAAPDVVAQVCEAGRLLGIAFQLYDDLAGTYGDPGETGKSRTADLREGKCTLLLVHARGTSSWSQVEPYWGNLEITEDDAALVRSALEACGSRAYVEQVAADHLRAGLEQAADIGVDAPVLTWLASVPARPKVGAA
ncbi:polyprenyl synthetase family protein [Mumia sp. zg.B53]|uniref:polyprenyl synthetase family protein n=1 Tax=unclassified Mumia TaxID=2621872 RepID=UPI001C6E2C68|nr:MULTISPECIES: polyprenyl synthetase family protein [unclassified Mumia]MBW9205840.1 polyprenyl synthetase family protein [Mumia sp. zg.B17]MBW9208156.1 polyprenyl synthetase family protein [Mumia sp. zg.B21]MBW9216111.1 polyprenyl synthetase family protein [Mumia sp. zg.B53]MDD9348228.1 polyprenyl synthetase family protein [Mumia sp.]